MPVLEWLNPAIFPSYLANGLYKRLVLIQSAEIWGIIGLTLIVMLSNTAIAALVRAVLKLHPPTTKELIAATTTTLSLLSFNYGWGVHSLEATTKMLSEESLSARALKIGTVQSNMGIFEKRQQPNEGHRRHLTLSRELEAEGADLIVWPESGYFFRYDADAPT